MISETLSSKHKLILGQVKMELEHASHFFENKEDDYMWLESSYYKMVVFTLYRSIEDMIEIIYSDRIDRSSSSILYENIKSNNIKSNMIDEKLLSIILIETAVLSKIKYSCVYDNATSDYRASLRFSPKNVNEVKPKKYNKDEPLDMEELLREYKELKKHRNTLFHSIVANKDFRKDVVERALRVFCCLDLIIQNL